MRWIKVKQNQYYPHLHPLQHIPPPSTTNFQPETENTKREHILAQSRRQRNNHAVRDFVLCEETVLCKGNSAFSTAANLRYLNVVRRGTGVRRKGKGGSQHGFETLFHLMTFVGEELLSTRLGVEGIRKVLGIM